MDRAAALRGIREGPVPYERKLIEATAERLGGFLVDEWEVTTDGQLINVMGRTRRQTDSVTFAPSLMLRAVPGDEGLSAAFYALARDLQTFLSRCEGRWPCEGAEPHARITETTINIWWGGSDEQQADARLVPIPRPV